MPRSPSVRQGIVPPEAIGRELLRVRRDRRRAMLHAVVNDLLDGDTVLRLPLLGLRLEPDAFFAQIERALHDAGLPACA
jgi:hypothetical protein